MSFELIHQITLEKNTADNESYKRNGESRVGILVANMCVFCVRDVKFYIPETIYGFKKESV